MSKTQPTKPFKKLDCQRKTFLRLPPNALKIWLYYFLREKEERRAWASEEDICDVTAMNRDTMRKWRNWLETNGWLQLLGHRDPQTGEFAVPIYRVDEGTIPESVGYGHSEDSRRKFRLRQPPKVFDTVQPKVSVTVPAESFGEEVEPKKQVDTDDQVAPSLLASELVGSEPSALRESSTPKKENLTSMPAALVSETTATPEPVWGNEDKTVGSLPCWSVVHEEFGLVASHPDEVSFRKIDFVMRYEQIEDYELRELIRWAVNHKFWSQRIVTVKALAEAMHSGIVDGGAAEKALVPQFRRHRINVRYKAIGHGD